MSLTYRKQVFNAFLQTVLLLVKDSWFAPSEQSVKISATSWQSDLWDVTSSSNLFVYFHSQKWAMAEQNSSRPQRKMSTSGESVYKVLGLEKGASAEEIKKAYRWIFTEFIKSWLPL